MLYHQANESRLIFPYIYIYIYIYILCLVNQHKMVSISFVVPSTKSCFFAYTSSMLPLASSCKLKCIHSTVLTSNKDENHTQKPRYHHNNHLTKRLHIYFHSYQKHSDSKPCHYMMSSQHIKLHYAHVD